jgi:hypothetical protein
MQFAGKIISQSAQIISRAAKKKKDYFMVSLQHRRRLMMVQYRDVPSSIRLHSSDWLAFRSIAVRSFAFIYVRPHHSALHCTMTMLHLNHTQSRTHEEPDKKWRMDG